MKGTIIFEKAEITGNEFPTAKFLSASNKIVKFKSVFPENRKNLKTICVFSEGKTYQLSSIDWQQVLDEKRGDVNFYVRGNLAFLEDSKNVSERELLIKERLKMWLNDPACERCGIITIWPESKEDSQKDDSCTIQHNYPKGHPMREREIYNFSLYCNKCNHADDEEFRREQKRIKKEIIEDFIAFCKKMNRGKIRESFIEEFIRQNNSTKWRR